MNKRFKTQWNAKHFKKFEHGEINNLPSMTVPDQSLTITEILQRHTRGIPFQAGKVPIYEGDNPVPDITKMDISEIHDLVQSSKEFIDDVKQKVNDKRSKKAAQDQKELEEFRKSKELADKSAQPHINQQTTAEPEKKP